MDDGLVLNIAESSQAPQRESAGLIKGGRWTDRVKAKRVAKRKVATVSSYDKGKQKQQYAEDEQSVEVKDNPRPAKKARKAPSAHGLDSEHVKSTKALTGTRAPQIISSLFTSNPEIKPEKAQSSLLRPVKPSNAPLSDKSGFSDLGLDPLIMAHLKEKMNIIKPMSIQREALPALLSAPDEEMSERDVFIQSQTGSGKTLSYLLPILQDLLPLSSLSYIDRSIGTLAIIVAPTRELAKQISDVMEQLLSLRLRTQDSDAEGSHSKRLTRWLVAGLLIGGESRSHEKARLRKGLPILVSTPGRLLDHLQNTSAFNAGKCRWLVLDEADRLMELGFEDTIKGILQALDGRRKLAMQAVQEGKGMEVGGWDWERRRRTVLCSATIREDVQVLAGRALVKPMLVKPLKDEKDSTDGSQLANVTSGSFLAESEKFTPPSQLLQKYIVAPLKLRLVALVALLRSILAQVHGRRSTKIIVFLSCTDSVDYHWRLLGGSSIEGSDETSSDDPVAENEEEGEHSKSYNEDKIALTSTLLPQTTIYRLHGSLPLQTRMASLKGFSSNSGKNSKVSGSRRDHRDIASTEQEQFTSSILLCTSIASRGLDLPLVRAVVQYDLPTEGGATEYVHRVGRTARVGKGGEAWSFVLPSEQGWIEWIQDRIRDRTREDAGKGTSLMSVDVQDILHGGFGGIGDEYEDRATQVQLAFERWVLKQRDHSEMARKAFLSHVRAYATHPSDEKHMFHVRNLHLGHLAKAFALRDAPGNISLNNGKKGKAKSARTKRAKSAAGVQSSVSEQTTAEKGGSVASRGSRPSKKRMPIYGMTTEQRMQEVVRRQGRLVKKGGALMMSGANEFQVATSYELERCVSLK